MLRCNRKHQRTVQIWVQASSLVLLTTALAAQQAIRVRQGGLIQVGVGPASEDAPPVSAPKEGTEVKPPKGLPVLYLRDKSQLAGWPQFEALDVETDYGKLSIPRDQLVRVRFARRVAPDVQNKIEQLIAELSSDDFDKREAATLGLKGMGAIAIPFLRKAAKSSNEEVKNRASSIVSQMTDKAQGGQPAGDESLPQVAGTDDEIVTTRMTVKGRIPREDFMVKSQYGELKVVISDLSGITFRAAGQSSAKVNVSAQNQPPGNWLDTKLDLQKNQKIKITASGQLSVRNYGIVSGPAGNTDWSGHPTFGNFPMLSLVAKVGRNGQPFLVGASYNGRVKNEGRLYLGIVTFTPYPSGAAGSYQAKVQAMGGD